MNIFDGMPETCSNCSRSMGLFCDACVEAYGQAFARSARYEVLALDQPWPLIDILKTLVNATEHLFDCHDCTCDKWESVSAALSAADKMIETLK